MVIAGAGTQTAGLAFGGIDYLVTGRIQKNMMVIVGHLVKFKHSKIWFSRSWYTNSSFSFWWLSWSSRYYRSNRRI
jgi:hypothetical protein